MIKSQKITKTNFVSDPLVRPSLKKTAVPTKNLPIIVDKVKATDLFTRLTNRKTENKLNLNSVPQRAEKRKLIQIVPVSVDDIGAKSCKKPKTLPTPEKQENQTVMCRICMEYCQVNIFYLKPKPQFLLIITIFQTFSPLYDDTKSFPVCDKLKFCFGIEFRRHKQLPNNICKACLSLVEASVKLKRYCEDSNFILEENFKFDEIEEVEIADSKNQIPPIPENRPTKADSHLLDLFDFQLKEVSVGLVKGNLQCNICPYKFGSSSALECHYIAAHKVSTNWEGSMLVMRKLKKTQNCDSDEEEYDDSDFFNSMLIDLKKPTEPPVKIQEEPTILCQDCGITVLRKSYNSHRFLHLPAEEKEKRKAFICKSCPKRFRNRSALRKHELAMVHSGEKIYKCNLCTSKFATAAAQKRHLIREHGEHTNVVCECGQKYLWQYELVYHKQKCRAKC